MTHAINRTCSFAFGLAAMFAVSISLHADVLVENWEFDPANDANGTALNSVTNTGTPGTSTWDFGGPKTQNGTLNIGDTNFFKWDVGTGTTFRTASFGSLTTGEYLFEFVIADWNLAGSEGETGNGIKFNFGTAASRAQTEFEVAQSPGTDIRVRTNVPATLGGTSAQHQLDGLDLTNTAPVTVQLYANLDTGEWTTQVDFGTGFVDLVTDGTGLTAADRIQLVADGGANGWEYNGVGGETADFIKIESISLTQLMTVPEPTSVSILFVSAIGLVFRRRKS